MFSLRRFFAPTCCSKAVTTVALQQQQHFATTALVSAMNLQAMCMQSSSSSSASPSSSSTSASASSSRNNNNNNYNNDRRNNNNNVQNRRNDNNNNVAAQRTIGVLELVDIRESAKDGREMRVSFRHDSARDQRVLSVTIRPQLGPRKTDPNDPSPQFDKTNRLTLRLKPKEVATILFWLSGRQGKDVKTCEVAGFTYKVNLAQQESGVILITLTGTKIDGTPSEPLSFELQPHQQVQFKVFLENALDSFFGLAAF